MMSFFFLFSLLQSQLSMSSRNAHISFRSSLTCRCLSTVMKILIDESSSLMTWSRCALVKNDVLENLINRERIILWQASWMIVLTWISNRNARISTFRSNVNFHFNVDLFNVYIALTTSRYLLSNDNTFLTANTRYSVTSIGITSFSRVRTVHFSMMNACSSRSKVSCTSKIMQRRFMKSICLTNANFRHSLFQWLEIFTRAIVIVNRSSLAVIVDYFLLSIVKDLRCTVILK